MKSHSIIVVCLTLLLEYLSGWSETSGNHALWVKVIGDQAHLEECYSVRQTTDGGYILAGRRSADTPGAYSNVYLVKTNSSGTVQWTSEIDPYPSYNSPSRVLGVVQANDGGYVAAGWVETQYYGEQGYLVKVDASGNLQWHYVYGNTTPGNEDDSFEAIAKTSDGGYILAGVTEAWSQSGLTDAWLVKVNADGAAEWGQVYGGSSLEYAYAVIQTSNGGYTFVGSTSSFGSETRVFVQGTSSTGAQQWLAVVDFNGSSDNGNQEGRSILQTGDGGYIVGGWYEAGSDPGIPFLLKLSAGGNEQWRKSYNIGSGSEKFSAINLTADGGYIAVGRTNSAGSGSYDVLITKMNATGIMEWSELYGGNDYDAAYSIHQTSDGGYIVGGKAVGLQWPSGTDMYLIRLGDVTALDSEPDGWVNVPEKVELFQNYPNPFNMSTIIEYQLNRSDRVFLGIYNVSGQLVRTLINEHQMPGRHSVYWNGKDDRGRSVSTGIYFYTIRTKDFAKRRKMIIIR